MERRRCSGPGVGDKAGNWQRWYTKNIPVADDLFDAHLHGLKEK